MMVRNKNIVISSLIVISGFYGSGADRNVFFSLYVLFQIHLSYGQWQETKEFVEGKFVILVNYVLFITKSDD